MEEIKIEDVKIDKNESLMWIIANVARLKKTDVDRLQLHAAVSELNIQIDSHSWVIALSKVCEKIGVNVGIALDKPDAAKLPLISWSDEYGWIIFRGLSPVDTWQVQNIKGELFSLPKDIEATCIILTFEDEKTSMVEKPAYKLFRDVFFEHKKSLAEASLGTILISIIALAISLFSMQVYDRVIPTKGYDTLFVLLFGVFIAMLFEYLLKEARAKMTDAHIIEMDSRLSREIFSRLLKIRLDQLPNELGTLSSQIRSYENIRAFLSSSTLYFLVDAPFGLLFLVLIGLIGSFWLALPPLIFCVVSLFIGQHIKGRVEVFSKKGLEVGNRKTGLLVETIEGAETIKTGGGAWNMLSRWISLNEETIQNENHLRNITERGSHIVSFLQQATYVIVVAVGAYVVTLGNMTTGALIACTILTGRITSPASMLYQLLVRYGNAKGALDGIERLYGLQMDNHNISRTIMLDQIHGNYELEDVKFYYQNSPNSMSVKNLKITSGEKIGVLGVIGSGKSTLLKLLSGMYQPLTGKILIDGIDVGQIYNLSLSNKIGYLQQEHRLFNGTLRENLLIGTLDPGDAVINEIAKKTGLLKVISSNPKGLDLLITEGGRGLSGGQKQLVALTRLIISKPNVWLLDEPTSSMDKQTADNCLNILNQLILPEQTLVLATHDLNLLKFVDRLIVVANNRVMLDGPKEAVLKRLQRPQVNATELEEA